jgi:hypothetical protein
MALALRQLEEWAEAQALFSVGLRLDLKLRDATNLTTDLTNVGDTLRSEGRHLAAAE